MDRLELNRTPVTDAGLVHLRKCEALGSLLLHDTKVTAEGIAQLKTLLPRCNIAFDAPTDPKSAIDVDR